MVGYKKQENTMDDPNTTSMYIPEKHICISEFDHVNISELLHKNTAVLYPVNYDSSGSIIENIPKHMIDAVIMRENEQYYGITYTYEIREQMKKAGLIFM